MPINTKKLILLIFSWLQHGYSCPRFRRVILTRKVCDTDLVFRVRLGFIGRSVHARLQVSVRSGYNLFRPGYHPDTHTDNILTSLYEKLSHAAALKIAEVCIAYCTVSDTDPA